MATTFSSFRTTTPSIVCCSAAPRKPDPSRKNHNWWAPIFGWSSSEPDYIINSAVKIIESDPDGEKKELVPNKNLFRGCFTEEKAKELRKKTTETSTFHDIMYHSPIASRLASDVSEQ
ncbi:hypothetical protein ACJIZ3_025531 [Penstemon smallii]|uniref:Uncharacterized protein n=1 Tax=Penstemon smallii TaxID=265156 RepID=A0ABD3TXG1_9LAMI